MSKYKVGTFVRYTDDHVPGLVLSNNGGLCEIAWLDNLGKDTVGVSFVQEVLEEDLSPMSAVFSYNYEVEY